MKSPEKQGPTAQETATADVSSQTWADYVERYRPAEAALIRKAEFTAGEKAQVKGEVAADTAAAFKGASRSSISANEQAGASAASGKSKLALAADAIAQGTAAGVGKGMAVAGGNVDQDQMNLKIAGFGRGVAQDATANMSRGAQRATRLALAASQARFEKNQATVNAVAGVAGAAAAKFKSNYDKKKSANEFDAEFGSGYDMPEVEFGFGDRSKPLPGMPKGFFDGFGD